MLTASGARHSIISGGLFAVAYIVSLFGVLDLPEGTDSDSAVQAAFADDQARTIVGVYLLAVAGLAFLHFLAVLRNRLRDSFGATTSADVAFAGGVVYVAILFVASGMWGVLALGTALDELPEPVDPALARTLTNLGFTLLLVFGLLAAAVMVVATSIVLVRARLGSLWLGWAGMIAAPLLLLGPFYMPQLLVPLWVVATSVGLARTSPEP
jgi:hypothetical protein